MRSLRFILLMSVLSPSAVLAGPDGERTGSGADAPAEDGDQDDAADPAAGEVATPTGSTADAPAPTTPPPATFEVLNRDYGEPERPLAVPARGSPPPVGPRVAAQPPDAAKAKDPDRPLFHADAGYRLVWVGNSFVPTPTAPSGLKARPHMAHATLGGMFDKHIYAAASWEGALNPARGTQPMVVEARVGWWDNALGEPVRRGPFHTMPGMAITYVGWRWVHDHYLGEGGEWAGTADAGGLVLGYTRAAPFGSFTVVTESQFSLYLAGWKGRSAFPLGLLNQRLSLGFDPVFIDVRFRSDPATGTELSAGASFQAVF